MNKRAKICLYIFLVCAFFALGVGGYFLFNNGNDQVMVGSRKFQVFNSVSNATSYSITVKDTDEINTGQAVYKINKQTTTDQNINNFTVQVEVDGEKIAEESYVQLITNKNETTDKIDCKIKDYTIIFFENGVQTETRSSYVDQTLTNVDADIFCCVVNVYFDNLFNKDGTYTLLVTPLDEFGAEIKGEDDESLVEEVEYNYTAFYEEDFLNRDDFFYSGTWYDYVIESKTELDNFVCWAILYRQAETTVTDSIRTVGSLSFYVKSTEITSANINKLILDAINDYPEYDALEDQNVYGKMEGNLGYLTDFNYYLDDNFLLTYQDLQEMDTSVDDINYNAALSSIYENDADFSTAYVTTGASTERTDDTFDIFADEDNVGVTVYNTEQLYMVVQSGEKPLFEDDESVVYQVWENALDVLREINDSDTLTDYEKALNIYRYICGEIVYDYVTYEYMQIKNDYSIKNFGNFSCFYLEGVFYDFEGLETHYAVCDGLAKAYSLLCNIEGINCTKVNGSVDGGNHAWNRIELHDTKYSADGFFYVDTTWGEGTYTDGESNYQVLTHTYFLFDEDTTREIFYPENLEEDNPSSDYNYYDYEEFEYNGETIDCYIESNDELKSVLSYAQSVASSTGGSFVVEIKFSREYYLSHDSSIRELLNLNTSSEINAWFVGNGVTGGWEWLNLMYGSEVMIFKIS